ncbi:hypothetical protein [Desulfosporosinus sp.]|uniref:hypothetical protein n=1 Tax=Desulfosporosinus sp. TaxID=157907 RepID=UPI0025C70134|nr:hypothetical protein [Desulfosporosinus sp.]
MLTTQSKLTVQALGFGARGPSFGDSILLKNPQPAYGDNLSFGAIVSVCGSAPSAILSTGDYRTGDYRAR